MRPGANRRRQRGMLNIGDNSSSSEMREGNVIEMVVGCLFGWVFGIFSICCLMNRRNNTVKFRNGIYLGFALRLIYAINETNQ
jgi:hypothetical protein